jgi:hypothetical protein
MHYCIPIPLLFFFLLSFLTIMVWKKLDYNLSPQVKESYNESDRIQSADNIWWVSGLWTDIWITSVGIQWDPSVGIRRNLSVGFDRPLLLISSFNKLVRGPNFRGWSKPTDRFHRISALGFYRIPTIRIRMSVLEMGKAVPGPKFYLTGIGIKIVFWTGLRLGPKIFSRRDQDQKRLVTLMSSRSTNRNPIGFRRLSEFTYKSDQNPARSVVGFFELGRRVYRLVASCILVYYKKIWKKKGSKYV